MPARSTCSGYGGHFAAAGLSLLTEQVEAFAAKFQKTVSATIPEQLLVPEITVDAVIHFRTWRRIEHLPDGTLRALAYDWWLNRWYWIPAIQKW